jgi:hypothetical protein
MKTMLITEVQVWTNAQIRNERAVAIRRYQR